MSDRIPISSFYIRTFGCQMNEHDSERMEQLLIRQGLSRADTPDKADLIIINTCSVRAKPEHKALSEAGRYRRRKKSRGVRLILAGCVAQQEGDRLLKKAPYLDAIIGPDAVWRLPEILHSVECDRGPVIDVDLHSQKKTCFVPLQSLPESPIRALVTIMKGCDNFCSYCVVPLVRGREVSRPLSEILDEIDALATRGSREVVLLGQNVNSYSDPVSGADFPKLLKAVDRQAAMERIRFTTSHPKDLGPRLIEAMAALDRVCEHVHLGLQSGSDRILRLMNRGYSGTEFIRKAEAIRKEVPRVSITSDIIVGFPSEAEGDFKDTLDTVCAVAFDQAFSFAYSPRPGTAASRLEDDVAADVKTERLATLQNLLNRLEAESLSRQIGENHPVLVEDSSIRDPAAWRGRTRCNRVLNFASSLPVRTGQTVEVHVLEVRGHTLWGEYKG